MGLRSVWPPVLVRSLLVNADQKSEAAAVGGLAHDGIHRPRHNGWPGFASRIPHFGPSASQFRHGWQGTKAVRSGFKIL
jgi:hypothetical protein